nr:MAG TPA: TRAF PROTEIN, TRAO PROTEIN, TRAN ADHESION, BACTERIAL SECRETION.5A [Bacteriophage sp.]
MVSSHWLRKAVKRSWSVVKGFLMSWHVKITLFLVTIFSGCASKEPQIIKQTEYQDVYITVSCIDKMPQKPERDRNDPDNQKKIAEYFKACEDLLKQCVHANVPQSSTSAAKWGEKNERD